MVQQASGRSHFGSWRDPSGTFEPRIAEPSRPVRETPGAGFKATPLSQVRATPLQEGVLVPVSTPRERALISQFRSTLLTTSLKSIRDRGHGASYLDLLPGKHHDAVRACIAGVWLPIELGFAHYDACDALGLPDEEQILIGREVGVKIQGTLLGSIVKLAKGAGATPWLCLDNYQKLYNRLFVGGGVEVSKVGPKEALIQCHDLQLARIPYFRTAFLGVNEAVCELFCTKAYVAEVSTLCSLTTLGYRMSWA